MKTTMKSYVKEVLARLQGDEDTVIAERNYRMANSAVKGQLAALDAKQITAEVDLEKAEDDLNAAKYPTTPIEDNSRYIKRIYDAQKEVDSAEKTLKNIKDSAKYARSLEKEFNATTK